MKKSSILLGGIVFTIVALYFFYQYQLSSSPNDFGIRLPNFGTWDDAPYTLRENKNYVELFRLVPESVSENGVITVNLPSEIEPKVAKEKIKIMPEVAGTWIEENVPAKMFFKPTQPLEIDKHYAVSLDTGKGVMKEDFLVQLDPEIVAIIPNAEEEADETMSISILFNRPMVPLSSIDQMNEVSLPIEIMPKTKGDFRWIGTRTLQFVPEDRLFRSANYEIKVLEGLKSLDQVAIKPFSHKFKTRPLRLISIYEGELLYNRPIEVIFNQPIDLKKTEGEIILKNDTTGENTTFIAEYGEKDVYNERIDKSEKKPDESVLHLWQKTDKFKRTKLWDFNTKYSFEIKKAYPKEGDLNLEETINGSYQVGEIISDFLSYSAATSDTFPLFFDPKGYLEVTFFEDIDLKNSKITALNLDEINYAKICRSEKDELGREFVPTNDPDCEKEDDLKRLQLTFEPDSFKNEEVVTINFETIKNKAGQILNGEVIKKELKIIPALKVLKSLPENGNQSADISKLLLCTTTPLLSFKDPKEESESSQKDTVEEKINYYYVGSQDNSEICPKNSFHNDLKIFLNPKTEYNLKLSLKDVFLSETSLDLSFLTRDLTHLDLNFFHFQKPYNVSTPKQTELNYATQNMTEVDLHICKVNGEKMINFTAQPLDFLVAPNNADCLENRVDKVVLPTKYFEKNYFTVDVKKYFENPLGHFVFTFSNPLYKFERNGKLSNIYERTYLTVSNLSVIQKTISSFEYPESSPDNLKSDYDKNILSDLFWVTDISTLKAISGARIFVYEKVLNKDNSSFIRKKELTGVTDKEGILRSKISTNLVGIEVLSGDDNAIVLGGYDNYNDWTRLSWGGSYYKDRRIFLYTDRPIYRLNQEVFLKGIYRNGYDGTYNVPTDEKIPVLVMNSQNEKVFETELSLTSFGTFETKFTLPESGPTGQYYIQAKEYLGYAYFDVEDYKSSAFQVETKTDKEEYLAGDQVNLDVNANYYFGVPVSGGEIEYSILTQNYYFDKYQDEYFNFDSGFYDCFEDCFYGDRFILRDKAKLNEDGVGKINFKADFTKWFKNADERTSKLVVVQTTVKSKEGETISDQKSFIVHAGNFYLGLAAENSFINENEPLKLKIKTVDKTGTPMAIDNLNLKVSKITWTTNKRQEVDGAYYYDSKRNLTEVLAKKVSTDKSGNGKEELTMKDAGEYLIQLDKSDSNGNLVKTSYLFYVYGKKLAGTRQNNDYKLDVVTNKSQLKVDENAEIIIKSPYESAKALITLERGSIYEYKIIDINQNLFKYSFPVKEVYIPNIYATVTLLSSQPEVKYGQANFTIDTDLKALDLEVKANKANYLPGEKVILDIMVKDKKNQPKEAEVSLAVADLSVLALKGNPKKDPVSFFFSGFPLSVATFSNLKHALFKLDVPVTTKGGGGGDNLAKKKRGVFKDTAFWLPDLKTNALGIAETSFTLPDNLTTWQIEALGVDKETKLGVTYNEFKTKKELMVTVLKPRFILPGDEFSIGAKVFNETSDTQELDVMFESATLELKNKDQAVKKIKLDAGKQETIFFKVIAKKQIRKGTYVFSLQAKNDKYSDKVEESILINKDDTLEQTATIGMSKDNKLTEYLFVPENIVDEKGGLTVREGATLAVFLNEGVESLFRFPDGSTQDISELVSVLSVLKNGLDLENVKDKFPLPEVAYEGKNYGLQDLVKIGLTNLVSAQKSDGGFSFFKDYAYSWFDLTLEVINALHLAKEAGFAVDSEVVKKAVNYTDKYLTKDCGCLSDEYAIHTYFVLNRARKSFGIQVPAYLLDRVKKVLTNENRLKDGFSNFDLSKLYVALSESQDIYRDDNNLGKLAAILQNRLMIDARGAFLPEGNVNNVYSYNSNEILNTAYLLKGLALNKITDPNLERILLWLISSKDKNGLFGSSLNNLQVMDALITYLKWQGENKADFNLKFAVAETEKNSFDFNAKTIFTHNILDYPINEFETGKLIKLDFLKTDNNSLKNNFYYDLALKYFISADQVAPRDQGFSIERAFYRTQDANFKTEILEGKVGEVLKGRLKVRVPKARSYVKIEDFIPAGVELINFNLSTEDQSIGQDTSNEFDFSKQNLLYPDHSEIRDNRLVLFVQNLAPGEYEYEYYVRVLVPGKFLHLPANVSEILRAENFGRTEGKYFIINS